MTCPQGTARFPSGDPGLMGESSADAARSIHHPSVLKSTSKSRKKQAANFSDVPISPSHSYFCCVSPERNGERNGSCPFLRGEGFSLSIISAKVSAFEENTSGKDAGFSFMEVSVGGDKGKAYMAVDLKVMNTNTGEIADARTVKATSESSGLRLGLNLGFFSGNLGEKAKTPTGKAIRGCIVKISQYLECSLLKGKDSSCMKEYDEKDSKRKQKTKDSIKLE
jgi:hypothetical protein